MLDYKLNKTFLRFLSTLFFVFVVFRPGPAHSQELELPATGVWNGFLNHDNVIECTNPASRSVAIRLVLRSNSGSIIDTHALPIPAFGTRHIQLNNYQIAGAYGTYLIEAAGGEEADLRQLYCLTMFYRFSSSSSTKPVEYAFAIPVNNPLRGETYGLFNSYNPILDQTPVFNWLSIYNPGAAPFSASVQVFRQDGTIDPAAGFYIAGLAPGERRDYPLGHPLGQVVGLYRIIADDPQAPYGAFLSRYSQRQNGSFNFAFAVAAANGSCRPGPITASTMDPATNWAEIANLTAEQLAAEITVRDAAGVIRHNTVVFLPPFFQHHVYLNQYIGERQVGSIEARCLDENAPGAGLLTQSVFYGHRDLARQSIEWSYISTPQLFKAQEADAFVFPVNTLLGAANWNKYFDAGSTFSAVQLAVHDLQGAVRRRLVRSLFAGSAVDAPVHEYSGQDFAGMIAAKNMHESAFYSGEMLRVFPDSRGGIGSITNIPARRILSAAAARGMLRVSSRDARWFTFRGAPRLMVGDSMTQGWMELGIDFDQHEYLKVLSERGINALLLWSYIGIVDQYADNRIGYHAPRLWPWTEITGNLVPPYFFEFVEHSSGAPRFSEYYFERLRSFVQAANERNIVFVITIHDGWAKGRFSGHPMNAVNGGQLFANYEYVQLADYNSEMPYLFNPSWSRRQKHQWILERFVEKLLGATADFPNVVYEVMNEGEWYDQNALRAFQQHFLRFIEERTELPIMVNAPSLRAEAAATAVSLHEPVWDSSTDAVEAYRHYVDAYDDSPQKPVVFSEPVPEYQGGAASRDALMRLMWGTLLAGSGFFVQNDLSWRAIPGEPDLIFDIEGHASRFFAARTNIDHYSPCEEYSSTGVCLGLSGQEYIVYAQSGDTFAMDLTAFSGSVTVRFYNPRTGQYHPGTSTISGGSQQTITKPDSGDWICVFQAAN